ncbi:MAG: hypothetical protein GX568_07715 [Candidatus Gastranaerophilales bacterium]|nr:hypothetical protein [Candidatus Gastranaerophilales bacterium]
MTDAISSYRNIQLKPVSLTELNSGNSAGAVSVDNSEKKKINLNNLGTVIEEQKKSGMGFVGNSLRWTKGFVKGVYNCTIGLVFNPFQLALIIGAGLAGALLLGKKGFSLNKSVKTELLAFGGFSMVKGIFDLYSYFKNKNSDKIEKAKKNIESFGKSCAYMCVPLAIPFVPGATKLVKTKGKELAQKALHKLV